MGKWRRFNWDMAVNCLKRTAYFFIVLFVQLVVKYHISFWNGRWNGRFGRYFNIAIDNMHASHILRIFSCCKKCSSKSSTHMSQFFIVVATTCYLCSLNKHIHNCKNMQSFCSFFCIKPQESREKGSSFRPNWEKDSTKLAKKARFARTTPEVLPVCRSPSDQPWPIKPSLRGPPPDPLTSHPIIN